MQNDANRNDKLMPIKGGKTVQFRWVRQPKQKQLLDLIEDGKKGNIFFGGPKGGMKSHSIRWIALFLASKYPGFRAQIWRRTTQDLKDNHLTKLFNEESPKELRDAYNQQDMQINFPNGSIVAFRYAETEKDLRQKQGGDWDLVAVDEESQWSEVEITQCLMPFARRAVPLADAADFVPKFVAGFNWGDISHSYNKRICVDKEFRENEKPKDYEFLPMYGWDNMYWSYPALLADGCKDEEEAYDLYFSWSESQRREYFIERSTYGKRLFQLPETARKQLLYGDPDVFEGMFFSMFSRKKHCDSVEKWELQPEFKLLGSLDYGAETCLEIVSSDFENRSTFCGELWTEKSGAALRAIDVADYLIDNKFWKLKIICDTNMNFDPDDPQNMDKAPINVFKKVIKAAFQARGCAGKEPTLTIVSKISPNDKGYRVFCNEAFRNGLSMDAIRSDATLMKALESQGYPLSDIRIKADKCPKLVESITSLVHDTKSHDGTDFDPKKGQDHAYDAAKMAYVNVKKAVALVVDDRPHWFQKLMWENNDSRGWRVGMG